MTVNAEYVHSNLGIHSLKAYARQQLKAGPPWIQGPATIELAEYTINHQLDACLQDLHRRKPGVIGFSCYIWNIESIWSLAADIRKLPPRAPLWLGGPEVSYNARKVLQDIPFITGIVKGEREEAFAQLVRYYADNRTEDPADCGKVRDRGLSQLTGLTYRGPDDVIADAGIRLVMGPSRVPFPYDCIRLEELERRIIYYESSRGCPFSCSYCPSPIDKQIRFRNLGPAKEELLFFLNVGVPQVRFVGRIFNCREGHAMVIWRRVQEHDNEVTNFRFETVVDSLGEEEMELLAGTRPGLIQLETGAQTTNVQVLEVTRRETGIDEIRRITSRINADRNVHQHLDLTAGLSYEGMESFQKSFDDVYSMEPERLQLGLLKVLKGSYMEGKVPNYGPVYSSTPSYEMLSTRWPSYDRVLELKAVEGMVEVHYNGRQFTCTLKALEKESLSPYQVLLTMRGYYQKYGLIDTSHSRITRYKILLATIEEYLHGPSMEVYRDRLAANLHLRENIRSRPSFARDRVPCRSKIRDFFIPEGKNPWYLAGYEGFDSRQMSKVAHVEAMGDKTLVLFGYRNRDPLTYNAKAYVLELNRSP